MLHGPVAVAVGGDRGGGGFHVLNLDPMHAQMKLRARSQCLCCLVPNRTGTNTGPQARGWGPLL